MPVDPALSRILEAAGNASYLDFASMPVAEAVAIQRQARPSAPADVPVARVEDRAIPSPHGPVPVRLYWPLGEAPVGLAVYMHGGGWVTGSIEGDDLRCRMLANMSGTLIVSVDYALSPEVRFPVALEQCRAVVDWAAAHAGELRAPAGRLALAGGSAGANLAAGLALQVRDSGGPRLALQLLQYPVIDDAMATASYRDFGTSHFLTAPRMAWYWDQYVPDRTQRANAYASPARAADLAGLPPAFIVTAEFDPLRDEGEAYAARLIHAGVDTRCLRVPGMTHGFLALGMMLPQSQAVLRECGRALRAALEEVR